MRLVLLSGGSGKRLWPLSNDARSKQFLKLLEDKERNNVSMVQRVYQQLNSVDLDESAVIATSLSQVNMIKNQIGDVPLVVEPERRDTFPAIALASAYLYSEQNVNLKEIVGVLPVDPYVEDEFFKSVSKLEKLVESTNADIALMGVVPTYPSSKYGYIVPREGKNDKFHYVDHFKEKPTENQAEELIIRGALWNCGVFAFRLEYIINILKNNKLPIDYNELKENYNRIPKNSFDYEVVEKAKNIVVQPYNGYWKDLGTWNTLTEEMAKNIVGMGTMSPDSTNTHLINELDIPVTILGLKDIVVAASPDGILVSDKAASPRLKELISDFDNRPMYEELSWGWYKILDHSKYKNSLEVQTKKICIYQGKNLSYHHHEQRSEVWTILKGSGELIFNGEIKLIQTGDVIQIRPNDKHSIRAVEELEIIEIQKGEQLLREDKMEPIYSWDQIYSSFFSKK